MDEKWMRLALELAEKGRGKVDPNPMVGAVIVKNDMVIGKGYHEYYGGNHGEIRAFEEAIEDIENSTLYVTLEPCSHHGKTPPCVDEIIKRKIKRVVIGCLDPNPLVLGKGVNKLIGAGIQVLVGVLEKECKMLNEVFIKYITEKKPFVTMKTAMSLDGKIAAKTGESKWISGEVSRNNVHKLRGDVRGIMVGVNTIILDNPQLTCRIEGGINPVRIIADSSLRIPINAKVLEDQDLAKTIIATTEKSDIKKRIEIERKGVEVLVIEELKGKVDLQHLMLKMWDKNIHNILLEGGSLLNYSALEQGIVDKVQFYISPKIIGGINSKTSIGGDGVNTLSEAFRLYNLKCQPMGEDILVEAYTKEW